MAARLAQELLHCWRVRNPSDIRQGVLGTSSQFDQGRDVIAATDQLLKAVKAMPESVAGHGECISMNMSAQQLQEHGLPLPANEEAYVAGTCPLGDQKACLVVVHRRAYQEGPSPGAAACQAASLIRAWQQQWQTCY